jgi:hypothetical protein
MTLDVARMQGVGATMEDWLFEFGQWHGARTPTLCAAVARPPQMSCSRWPIGRSPKMGFPNTWV